MFRDSALLWQYVVKQLTSVLGISVDICKYVVKYETVTTD